MDVIAKRYCVLGGYRNLQYDDCRYANCSILIKVNLVLGNKTPASAITIKEIKIRTNVRHTTEGYFKG